MKKVLVVCGTGVATSQIVAKNVREHLLQEGIQASVTQARVMDFALDGNDPAGASCAADSDLVVATTDIPGTCTAPVIKALPLLTGYGQAESLDEIAAALR
ncbi:PTS sugar transporter subunit IIB [Brachybacterium sp. DNPG3]